MSDVPPTPPPAEEPERSGRGSVQDVVTALSETIRRGDLRFGDRLPAERTLAGSLNVSRATLRKGIRVLADAGVLEIRSGAGRRSGTVVRSELVPAELIGRAVAPIGEISGVLQARRLFEPRVAQLAGSAATNEDLAEIAQVLEQQREAAAEGDVERVRALDPSFHLAIARATHNETVVALMQTLLQRLDLPRQPTKAEGEAEWTVEIHERTLAAIAGRDPFRIEVTMDEHLRMLERSWEQESGAGLPREVPDFLQPRSGAGLDP